MNATWTIKDDGTAVCEGVDMSNGSKPIELVSVRGFVDRNDLVFVFKVPAGTYWRGIGMERGYSATEFQVWRVLKRGQYDGGFYCERIIDFDMRAKRVNFEIVKNAI